jgi:hypothetical protein
MGGEINGIENTRGRERGGPGYGTYMGPKLKIALAYPTHIRGDLFPNLTGWPKSQIFSIGL